MGNLLVKLRPVSGATSTPDAGIGAVQKMPILINGMVDGHTPVIHNDIVYISDYDKHVIYRYKLGSSASKIFAGTYGVSGDTNGQAGAAKFNKPAGMCIDARGTLWVVDSGNAKIKRIDENANVYTVATIPAEVLNDVPGGICVDSNGNIFYVDNTP